MHDLEAAIAQAWPPFVLVAGLLAVGAVAHAEGLFDRAGAVVANLPGPPVVVLFWCMALVAVVTATMNLDTAVVFLTPVLILVARQRGLEERPFLYAALFMANASSLFLPGANLTNLLVLAHDPMSGSAFARAFFPPALAASAVTAVGLALLLRVRVRVRTSARAKETASDHDGESPWPIVGACSAALVGVLTVALPHPAVPVLAVGLVAAAIACFRGTTTPAAVLQTVGPLVLVALFGLCVALGVVAREWTAPTELIADAGRWSTVGIGALASISLNNLPAAVLLSAHGAPHARELLLGLNLGPSLAVTGSLSSYLWYRAARQVDAEPSLLFVSRLGVVLAPAAVVAAMLAMSLVPLR